MKLLIRLKGEIPSSSDLCFLYGVFPPSNTKICKPCKFTCWFTDGDTVRPKNPCYRLSPVKYTFWEFIMQFFFYLVGISVQFWLIFSSSVIISCDIMDKCLLLHKLNVQQLESLFLMPLTTKRCFYVWGGFLMLWLQACNVWSWKLSQITNSTVSRP